jgi:hypothetical protein
MSPGRRRRRRVGGRGAGERARANGDPDRQLAEAAAVSHLEACVTENLAASLIQSMAGWLMRGRSTAMPSPGQAHQPADPTAPLILSCNPVPPGDTVITHGTRGPEITTAADAVCGQAAGRAAIYGGIPFGPRPVGPALFAAPPASGVMGSARRCRPAAAATVTGTRANSAACCQDDWLTGNVAVTATVPGGAAAGNGGSTKPTGSGTPPIWATTQPARGSGQRRRGDAQPPG